MQKHAEDHVGSAWHFLSSTIFDRRSAAPWSLVSRFRSAHTSKFTILVRFLDLTFLSELAAKTIGTSNPSHQRESREPVDVAPLFRLSAKLSRRRTSIGPNEMARDGSFAALAGLHLLERMGQSPDRARQDEQPPAQRRREAELREHDAGSAVDIQRNGPSLLCRKLRLERAGDGGEAATHRAAERCGIDELEQAGCAWIAGVKAMTEAGNMRNALRRERCHFGANGLRQPCVADRTV